MTHGLPSFRRIPSGCYTIGGSGGANCCYPSIRTDFNGERQKQGVAGLRLRTVLLVSILVILAPAAGIMTATAKSPRSVPGPANTPSGPVLFGVYPGGGTGDTQATSNPSGSAILNALSGLRGAGQLSVHLYTAWSWYDPKALDAEVSLYSQAGYFVTLTVKYSPPSGHNGDAAGYAKFVASVAKRYGSNPMLYRLVVGNEINVANGNPNASDGPFENVQQATVQGVLAASRQLAAMDSSAQVGFDLAVQTRNSDAQFMADLTTLGGPSFVSAVGFLGLNVYPELWPAGTGNPYQDMATYLADARGGLMYAGFGSNVSIDVLENGYPTLDNALQASYADAFVHAVCNNAESLGISGYSWFDLWDANTASTNYLDHYGLLQSDMAQKPAYAAYQQAMTNYCFQGSSPTSNVGFAGNRLRVS